MPLVRPVAALALLLLAAAPLAAQAAPYRELDAVYAAFRDAYARLDAEAVTRLYAMMHCT